MMTDMKSLTHALLLSAILLSSSACGSGGGGTGTAGTGGGTSTAGTGGDTGTGGNTSTGGTGGDTSTGGTGGGTSTSTGTGGAAPMLYVVDVSKGGCFTLATATASTDNPCLTGDLYFLTGVNVDLDSANLGEPAYCVTGKAADLAAVPSDYAACAWQGYIEGADGLQDTGYVVRDRTGAHHYQMQIVSNTLPNLQLHLAKID
jgi:hypothetical protein